LPLRSLIALEGAVEVAVTATEIVAETVAEIFAACH
jgi:hypothetical protein